MNDWYLGLDWNDLFKDGELTQSKRKAAKDLMQDKDVLETMRFLDFIGLEPTEFEETWQVKFSLHQYQQYFHTKGYLETMDSLKERLDKISGSWKYIDEKEDIIAAFHLISGFDYSSSDGVTTVHVTKQGMNVISELRGR